MTTKILFLDPQKKADYRISKDTSGGYGTGNNFGYSLVPKLLKSLCKKYSDWPPVYLAYCFSVLKELDYEVSFSQKLPDEKEIFDYYIVTSSIVCCETELETIRILKNKNKKVFVIGPFATSISQPYIDAGATVILGEPEFYFLQKPNLQEDSNKDKISFNHNYTLDDLPYPRWDKVTKNLGNANKLFGNFRSVPILATRGCPYSCRRYCVYPLQQGTKVRQRSVEKIVDEMEFWKNKYGIKMFIFRDPVFSINKKHTIDFCQELINRKLKIKFVIETHLRILDSELILTLVKAGLKGVKVGVESAETEVLKQESRFTVSQDEQLSKIRELEKFKIMVSAMFIVGFPSDTDKTIKKTIEYAKHLNTSYAQFSIWTPYPGTPVFLDYKDKIIEKRYEKFTQYELVYKHLLFNKKEIRKYLNDAYSNYYSRFSWLFKFTKGYVGL